MQVKTLLHSAVVRIVSRAQISGEVLYVTQSTPRDVSTETAVVRMLCRSTVVSHRRHCTALQRGRHRRPHHTAAAAAAAEPGRASPLHLHQWGGQSPGAPECRGPEFQAQKIIIISRYSEN